jgi:hypothetical protein
MVLATGFFPLYRAWRATAGSTLRHAVAWAAVAWATVCLAAWLGAAAISYLAVSLTACAGVAVLGARRPGSTAWDFVVLGLLAALLRPFLEGFGELRLETAHIGFLAIALGVGIGNYLPTRQAGAALLVGIWSALELHRLSAAAEGPSAPWLVALAPWLAWLSARRRSADELTAKWLAFRDRFGFLWGQRIREQFNRAAENAGLPITLGWCGPRAEPGADTARAVELLRAVLRRFGSE